MLKVKINNFFYPNSPTNKAVISNLLFQVNEGAHLAILGESGCGKSTLLHLIYGLLHLEKGTISWKGQSLKGPKFNLIPGEKFMKLVAQEYNLMPYITVAETIATHLSRQNKDKDNDRVIELLTVVGLLEEKTKKIKELSGGQKQRVALARALAKEPEILLLDEPFISIDNFLKNKLRRRLYAYLKKQNITCITATHESEEALSFADNILLLKDGTKKLYGTPSDVYINANTEYLKSFFGEVSVLRTNNKKVLLFSHELIFSKEKTPIEVKVKDCYFKGSHYLISATYKKDEIFFQHKTAIKKGILVYLKRFST